MTNQNEEEKIVSSMNSQGLPAVPSDQVTMTGNIEKNEVALPADQNETDEEDQGRNEETANILR